MDKMLPYIEVQSIVARTKSFEFESVSFLNVLAETG